MLLLHRVHLAVLVLELVMLAGFVAFGFSNPFARESLAILFDPSGLGPWFVVGLVGLGLLVPLAVEVFVTVTKRLVRALPVDLLCIAGGWCCDSALFGRGCIEDARLPPLYKLVILYNAERMIPQKE